MNTYNDIFSNPKKIFEKSFKTTEEIKDKCIYILDTNVLLLPYTVGNKELTEIEKIYSELLQKDKLLIPAQVAKEFAKNRPKKLEEIYKNVSDFLSRIDDSKMPSYPMFNQLPVYMKIGKTEEKINTLKKEYRKEIKELLGYIKNLNWNDQVSQIYTSLFKEKYIIDFNWEFKTLKEELESRLKFNLPPAYKDKGKDDGGIGDYIIWKDIVKIGIDNNTDVIFVTGDEKADWFHQSMKSKMYPRYELLHEFKESTSGKDVNFISLSDLIELYSTNKEVVKNIRIVETFKFRKSISSQLRAQAILMTNSKCQACGVDGSFDGENGKSFLEIHHIKPLHKGGNNTLENIVVLCPNCHKKTHDRLTKNEEFLGGSPCQMSGQICPSCKIGIMSVSQSGGEGVECNICGLFIPS